MGRCGQVGRFAEGRAVRVQVRETSRGQLGSLTGQCAVCRGEQGAAMVLQDCVAPPQTGPPPTSSAPKPWTQNLAPTCLNPGPHTLHPPA